MKTERSTEEILTQLRAIDEEGGDMFGVIKGHLMEALPLEAARPFLKPGITDDVWLRLTEKYETPREAAHAYMPFAASKIVGERGLSANRNVDHMRGLVYLHGGAAALQELEETEYGWYGRTQMAKAAELLGLSGEWAGILALEEGDK